MICGTYGPLGILLLHKATSYLLVLTFCHFSLHIFLWSAVSKRASGFSGPVVLRIWLRNTEEYNVLPRLLVLFEGAFKML